MTDYSAARQNMVEGQIRTNDVTDRNLQSAMSALPREQFVPKSKQSLAYMSKNLEYAPGRYLMGPRAFSKMAQALTINASDLVLVVGAGMGYSAAVFGQMADSVVALESDGELASAATALLSELEIDNIAVVSGDASEGLAKQGPFDVIFFDGSTSIDVSHLTDQLSEGGRFGVFVQDGPVSRATIYTRTGDRITSRVVFDASVMPLPGFEKEIEFQL